MRRIAFATVAALTLGIVSSAALSANATADEFYKGKKVNLIVPSTAGSGYDAYARLVARHLPKHLSGEPVMVVQNMPGAGGIRAANFIYNVAPGDGLTIGQMQSIIPLEPFYQNPQAQYDPVKLHWLGSPGPESSVFVVWHTAPVKTIEDAKTHELVIATGGAASTGAFYARVVSAMFGVKMRFIEGYQGVGEAFLAMERGENDGYPAIFWSTLKSSHADWLREKKVRLLLQYGGEPNPELKGVPFATDLMRTPEDRLTMEIAAAPFAFGRPFALPPSVPPQRVKEHKAAMAATFHDPEYRADCEKQRLECDNPVSGDAIVQLIKRAYSAPEAVHQRLLEIYRNPATAR
jgi:tripartite-type tricarboxylate transporter receptor subunit TctC